MEQEPEVMEAIARYRREYRIETADLWRKALRVLDASLTHGTIGDKLRAADMVAKLRGEYAAEKHEVTAEVVTLSFDSLLPPPKEAKP